MTYGQGHRIPGDRRVRTPEDVVRVCQDLRDETQEHFCALMLNAKHQVLARQTVGIGSLTEVTVHPREVFRVAVQVGAAAIVLVHNHPSGDPDPSTSDNAITLRLRKAGAILGIPVLDHVILGDEHYHSYQEDPYWTDFSHEDYIDSVPLYKHR